MEYYSKLSLFAQIIYGPIIGLVKLRIIWMLQRIFCTPKFRLAAYGIMAIAAAWIAMPILVAILVCRPVAYNWDKSVPGGHCGNKALTYACVSVVDLISDALIVVLPMRAVFNLQVRTAHKIALAGIFAFGTVYVDNCFPTSSLIPHPSCTASVYGVF